MRIETLKKQIETTPATSTSTTPAAAKAPKSVAKKTPPAAAKKAARKAEPKASAKKATAKKSAAPKAAKKAAKKDGEARKNQPVQYTKIASMYTAGKSITEIAKATDRFTTQADPTASLRSIISRMLTVGYKDAKGKVVKLERRERSAA